MNRNQMERELRNNPDVDQRTSTLKLAQEINPQFCDPHIVGGYLRNILLGCKPNDCDVVFKGTQLNQPGVLEAVQEAEAKLGIPPYLDWEFENITATGYSKDLYSDVLGRYSFHTDYLTMVLMDTNQILYIGEEEKTLTNYEQRIYDLHFQGIMMWVTHRAKGRSYQSCLVGDLIRCLYLCQGLNLTPSPVCELLVSNFDTLFQELNTEDQKSRLSFWLKKTKGNPAFNQILDKYAIYSLRATHST